MQRWLDEERRRDACQWKPVRPCSSQKGGAAEGREFAEEAVVAEAPSVIEFDNIRDSLFLLGMPL